MQQGIVDWEDLDIFFDEFAVPGSLLIQKTETTLALDGILDTPYMKREFGDFIIDAEDPSFTCKWHSEMSDARQGDELTVGDTTYYLSSAPQSDGTGLAALILVPADTQDDEGDAAPPQMTPKPLPIDADLFKP